MVSFPTGPAPLPTRILGGPSRVYWTAPHAYTGHLSPPPRTSFGTESLKFRRVSVPKLEVSESFGSETSLRFGDIGCPRVRRSIHRFTQIVAYEIIPGGYPKQLVEIFSWTFRNARQEIMSRALVNSCSARGTESKVLLCSGCARKKHALHGVPNQALLCMGGAG
jgi:hypothetical protein